MKVAFDTSVLVPALVRAHAFHARADVWLQGAVDGSLSASTGWHAVAETWSVLTRLPLTPPLTGERARLVVERIRSCVALVEPDAQIYDLALRRCATMGLRSGAIFDALHLISAERVGADLFLTFNRQDFERLRTDRSPRLVVPPEPPSLEIPATSHADFRRSLPRLSSSVDLIRADREGR